MSGYSNSSYSIGGQKMRHESVRASSDVAVKTIYNVELITTGDWLASTGEVTFTEDHLASIMASVEDPFIKEPRLILGHTPDDAPPDMGADGFFGEQPTIGKFVNLRLIDNGRTIMADLAGVPAWLEEILPTAYPSRSVEVYWDVKTQKGEYSAIMPRVAALGINLPAVATLEDLQVLYSEEGPEGVQLVSSGDRVAASRKEVMPASTRASVEVDQIRQAYYNDFAQGDRYWWWLKAMFANPAIIIADDEDTGKLYAVPYSVSTDSVEFGEPVEVFQQYVETESGKVAAQQAAERRMALSAFLSGADKVYEDAKSSRTDNRTKEAQVPRVSASIDVGALRSRLGLTTDQLPDDATEDQINEAIASTAEPPANANPDAPAAASPGTGDPAENVAQPGNNEPDQPGATTGPGPAPQLQASNIAPEALAQLQADAAAGREARAEQLTSNRMSFLDNAVKKGKFPPSAKAGYMSQLEQGGEVEKATREFIDGLTENVIPVDETGGDANPNDPTQMSEYDRGWLSPGERARLQAAEAGNAEAPRVVQEV